MLPPNPGELHMTWLLKSVHAHSPSFCFNHAKWKTPFEVLGDEQPRKRAKCDFTLPGAIRSWHNLALWILMCFKYSPHGHAWSRSPGFSASFAGSWVVSKEHSPSTEPPAKEGEASGSHSYPPSCPTNSPHHLHLPKIPITPNPHQLGISQNSQSRGSSCSRQV